MCEHTLISSVHVSTFQWRNAFVQYSCIIAKINICVARTECVNADCNAVTSSL